MLKIPHNIKVASISSISFRFMLKFILLTLLFIILNIIALVFFSSNRPLMEYIPYYQSQDVALLNWEEIHKLGGYGYVIQEDGLMIWHSKNEEPLERLDVGDLLNQNLTRENNRANFTFKTPDGNWLIMNYPSSTFSNEPTYIINSSSENQRKLIIFIFLGLLILYISMIYLLFHNLSKHLEDKMEEIYEAKEEDKKFFLSGLAHDIKTPLSTIMAYSQAITDGVVIGNEVGNYLDTIYHQTILLKERVNDMTSYANLAENLEDSLVEGDILESIRRYITDNYDWYTERGVSFEIGFDDQEVFITSFNPKLFNRLLQNLFTNSVQHNDEGIIIYVYWIDNEKKLIIGDNGRGIPNHILNKMFEPMVTGDQSRTGDHHRGMGLATVRSICQLHGWRIIYRGQYSIFIA